MYDRFKSTLTNRHNKKIALVFRHGARSPTDSALKCFFGTAIGDAWGHDALGELSSVGLEQSKRLGKEFKELIKDKTNLKKISYFASPNERTLQSGKSFLKGFNKTNEEECVVADSPVEILDAGLVFRPWYEDLKYRDFIKGLLIGNDKAFSAKAESEKDFLETMKIYMSEKYQKKSLEDALYRMTYFLEVIECEHYWPKGKPKSNLSDILSESEKQKIKELALWVLDYQWFKLPESRVLGERFYKLMLENAKKDDLTLYSVHDFSILILLSAIGMKNHPTKPMGFSSYLRLQFSSDGESIERVVMNAQPFQNVAHKEEVLRIA